MAPVKIIIFTLHLAKKLIFYFDFNYVAGEKYKNMLMFFRPFLLLT